VTGLQSCIYRGTVRHARHRPISHKFNYRLFLLYLDLSEIDRVFAGRLLWSARRPALARFRRRDHLGDPSVPLDQAVRELVRDRTGCWPDGPVRLLTHLSYFGYYFNPISIYYCFAAKGGRVDFLVLEVSNTPWGERHCYVLDTRDQAGPVLRHRGAKEFHVSPFMGMQMGYRWLVTIPGEKLAVSVQGSDSVGRLFDADLELARAPISAGRLARSLVAHPFMTGKVIAAIYWQAFRLLLKGAPLFPHPKKRTSDNAAGCEPARGDGGSCGARDGAERS
jgi:hypothetical protein